MNARGDYEIKDDTVQIAMIYSGFVAKSYMQGLDNVNHQRVAVATPLQRHLLTPCMSQCARPSG